MLAILAISILSISIAVPIALANIPKPIPVIPSECASAQSGTWTLKVNVHGVVHNDEDSGFVKFWALDNYQKSFIVWQSNTVSTTFCILAEYSGQWTTFKGAVSPQTGVTQPVAGSGDINGGYIATLTSATFTPSKPTTGSIGTFDYGGTKADILSTTPTGGTPISWTCLYFDSVSCPTSNLVSWAWVYTQHNGVGYGNMWVNAAAGSFGDIVTYSTEE